MPSQWLAVPAGVDSRARARQLRQSWERLLALRELKSDSGPEPAVLAADHALQVFPSEHFNQRHHA